MKRIVFIIFNLAICILGFSQQYEGYFRTVLGNSTYHHFTRNGGGSVVYINQLDTTHPILRLSSGTSTANEGIKFTVENNGYIGIGTTTPTCKMEVLKAGNLIQTPENNLIAKFSDSEAWCGIGIYGNIDNGAFIHLGYDTNPKAVELVTFDNYFVIKTDGLSRFFIGENGNIGIGKKYDSTIKLDVAGTIRADEILVEDIAATNLNLEGNIAANNIMVKANGNTADFVFSDSYNLKDLTEVENYIKTHKHLPDIPSADEMEASGVNLAEINKLLLQKVEELTLYIIEKDKQMEKQQNMYNDLEKQLVIIKETLLNNNIK